MIVVRRGRAEQGDPDNGRNIPSALDGGHGGWLRCNRKTVTRAHWSGVVVLGEWTV